VASAQESVAFVLLMAFTTMCKLQVKVDPESDYTWYKHFGPPEDTDLQYR